MSLDLPSGTPDLFAKAAALSLPTPPPATSPVLQTTRPPANATIGGVLSAALRDDPAIRKQMTPVEQAAVEAVVKNVGMPDEYPGALEYVLRALPYVKSTYATMDVIHPSMPSNEEISILMRFRYIHL